MLDLISPDSTGHLFTLFFFFQFSFFLFITLGLFLLFLFAFIFFPFITHFYFSLLENDLLRIAALKTLVASIYSVRLAIFAFTSMPLYHRYHAFYNPTHTVFSVEIPPCVDLGKLGATSSTRCPETKCQKVPLNKSGSNSLGHPVPNLV